MFIIFIKTLLNSAQIIVLENWVLMMHESSVFINDFDRGLPGWETCCAAGEQQCFCRYDIQIMKIYWTNIVKLHFEVPEVCREANPSLEIFLSHRDQNSVGQKAL